MPSRFLRFFLFLLAALILPRCLAQPRQLRGTHDVARVPQLSPLMRAAGTIFSGQVTSVRMVPAQAGAVACVEIRFRVSHGFRGVHAGQELVIREWEGLWARGPHYRVGERLMLFLYPPGASGLTSPVGGASGRLPVDDSGRIVTPHSAHPIPYRDFARALRAGALEEQP